MGVAENLVTALKPISEIFIRDYIRAPPLLTLTRAMTSAEKGSLYASPPSVVSATCTYNRRNAATAGHGRRRRARSAVVFVCAWRGGGGGGGGGGDGDDIVIKDERGWMRWQ